MFITKADQGVDASKGHGILKFAAVQAVSSSNITVIWAKNLIGLYASRSHVAYLSRNVCADRMLSVHYVRRLTDLTPDLP